MGFCLRKCRHEGKAGGEGQRLSMATYPFSLSTPVPPPLLPDDTLSMPRLIAALSITNGISIENGKLFKIIHHFPPTLTGLLFCSHPPPRPGNPSKVFSSCHSNRYFSLVISVIRLFCSSNAHCSFLIVTFFPGFNECLKNS